MLAACAAGGTPTANRWVGGPGQGGGRGAPVPPASADDGMSGQDGQPQSNTPGKPGSPPSQPAPPPNNGPENFLARIPQFPPAPPAEKITLPPGPNAAWLTHIPTTQKVAFL